MEEYTLVKYVIPLSARPFIPSSELEHSEMLEWIDSDESRARPYGLIYDLPRKQGN